MTSYGMKNEAFSVVLSMGNENALVRYKAKQFIGIIAGVEAIKEFDVELYFALVEKMTVFDGGRVIVVLLDGTEIECEI